MVDVEKNALRAEALVIMATELHQRLLVQKERSQ